MRFPYGSAESVDPPSIGEPIGALVDPSGADGDPWARTRVVQAEGRASRREFTSSGTRNGAVPRDLVTLPHRPGRPRRPTPDQ